jgi:hypothetical protein
VRYDDNTTGLTGYDQDDINVFFGHQLTERLGFGATVAASYYDPDDPAGYQGYDASLGVSYAFSETLSGDLYVGRQWIESETDLGTETVGGTASGTIYGFGLSKQFERSSLNMSVRRGAVPSGASEPLLQESLTLGYSYQVSPRLSVSVPAAIFRNETIAFTGLEDEEQRIFFSTRPQLNWLVTEDLVLRASYRYQYQRFEEEGTSASSNAVFLTLSYIWPTESAGPAP